MDKLLVNEVCVSCCCFLHGELLSRTWPFGMLKLQQGLPADHGR